MMQTMRCGVFQLAVGLVVCFAHASPIVAQQDGGQYRHAITTAVAEFERGNWQEARAMFKRAHAIAPSARTWRGMGVTAFELKLYAEAIEELEAALADERKRLTPALRKDTNHTLELARNYVATFEVRVEPEDATVLVDDRPVTLGPDGKLLINPGRHSIEVTASGYGSIRRNLFAQAGEQGHFAASLETALAPPPQAPAAVAAEPAQPSSPATEPAPAPTKNPRPFYILGWTSGAVALASAGVAVGFGLGAAARSSDLDKCEDAQQMEPAIPLDCDQYHNEGLLYQKVAIATGVAAGVLGVVAAVGFAVGIRRKRAGVRQEVALTPTGVSYALEF